MSLKSSNTSSKQTGNNSITTVDTFSRGGIKASSSLEMSSDVIVNRNSSKK